MIKELQRISWDFIFGGSKSFRDCVIDFYCRPSAFGTSPKYDKLKSECGFKVYIVGFGGDSAMGIFLQARYCSSFIIHNSSLLFGNDEVVRNLSTVVGKIKELVK